MSGDEAQLPANINVGACVPALIINCLLSCSTVFSVRQHSTAVGIVPSALIHWSVEFLWCLLYDNFPMAMSCSIHLWHSLISLKPFFSAITNTKNSFTTSETFMCNFWQVNQYQRNNSRKTIDEELINGHYCPQNQQTTRQATVKASAIPSLIPSRSLKHLNQHLNQIFELIQSALSGNSTFCHLSKGTNPLHIFHWIKAESGESRCFCAL